MFELFGSVAMNQRFTLICAIQNGEQRQSHS